MKTLSVRESWVICAIAAISGTGAFASPHSMNCEDVTLSGVYKVSASLEFPELNGAMVAFQATSQAGEYKVNRVMDTPDTYALEVLYGRNQLLYVTTLPGFITLQDRAVRAARFSAGSCSLVFSAEDSNPDSDTTLKASIVQKRGADNFTLQIGDDVLAFDLVTRIN